MVGSFGSVKSTATGGVAKMMRVPPPLVGEGSDDDEFDAFEDTAALGCVCVVCVCVSFDVSMS